MSSEKLYKQKKSQMKRRRSLLINSSLLRTNLEKQAVPLMHLMYFSPLLKFQSSERFKFAKQSYRCYFENAREQKSAF